MSEHQHSHTDHYYPAGWLPDDDAGGTWVSSQDMSAWRYCPPCGARLVDSGYVGDDPQCEACGRPWGACPCGCIVQRNP
jgi:hypothetical protein